MLQKIFETIPKPYKEATLDLESLRKEVSYITRLGAVWDQARNGLDQDIYIYFFLGGGNIPAFIQSGFAIIVSHTRWTTSNQLYRNAKTTLIETGNDRILQV